MKAWLSIVAVAVGAAGLWLAETADAHGSRIYAYPHVSIGYGYGYGYGWGYRPYGYYYPGAYVGVWPRQHARRVTRSESGDVRLKQLYVYPAAGQSADQLADDRYACHTWSVDQAGFDPTLGAGEAEQADAYARAMTACLEARSYVVR